MMQQNVGALLERGEHLSDLEGRAGEYSVVIITIKRPIVDPPRWGQCIIDLFTRDTAQGHKYYLFSTWFQYNL